MDIGYATPIELLRDLHPTAKHYETVWHGARWRDFPQPVVAQGDEPRQLQREVADHMRARAGKWLLIRDIRATLGCSSDDVFARLYKLRQSGCVERQKVPLWGRQRWVYRWVDQGGAL